MITSNHKRAQRPRGGVRGAVLLELVLIVPVFLLLLAGAVDFSLLRREQFVLSEAARAAVRAVLAAPPFTGERTRLDSYVQERYQRAITLARYIVAANGLDPEDYSYRIFDVARPEPAGRAPYHTVQFNVSSRDASRFFVFPDAPFKLCLGASGIITGAVLATSFSLADPSVDEECAPEES